MATFNKVFFIGNLTRDPDVRSLPSGMNTASFGLAVNRRYTASNGEKKEETCFIDVVVFGKQAEVVGTYLTKGRQVLLEGRLQYRTWETPEGAKRSKHELVAEQVTFLGNKPTEGQDSNAANAVSQDEEEVPF